MRRVLVLLFVLLAVAPAAAQEEARAWIGAAIEPGPHGVRINQVIEDTPALRAGLLGGDEVLSIDGEKVTTTAGLINRIQARGVGAKVKLQVQRGDKELTIELPLEARPDELSLLRAQLVG